MQNCLFSEQPCKNGTRKENDFYKMTNTKIDNIIRGLTEWYETTDIDNLLLALKIQDKI